MRHINTEAKEDSSEMNQEVHLLYKNSVPQDWEPVGSTPL